jgi:hypothetical protein
MRNKNNPLQTQGRRNQFFSGRRSIMRVWGIAAAAACLAVALLVSAQESSALDIEHIYVYEGAFFTNGVITNYFWGANIRGTGLTNGTVQVLDTGFSYPLVHSTTDPLQWGVAQTFATFGDDLFAHPIPCNNEFFFNQKPGGSYEDNVTLGYNVPTGVTGLANITFPVHNSTGVALNPTYAWNSVLGFGQDLGLFVNLGFNSVTENVSTVNLYSDFPESNMSKTSWQPGFLAPGTKYEFEAMVMNMDPTTSALTVKGDLFSYYGMRGWDNHVDFTTGAPVPEPMSVMLVGTGLLVFVGWRTRRRMA